VDVGYRHRLSRELKHRLDGVQDRELSSGSGTRTARVACGTPEKPLPQRCEIPKLNRESRVGKCPV